MDALRLGARGKSAGDARARRLADIGLAALVLLIVGMMIVPLPTTLLDILIAGNISIGVLMMLVAMYVPSGLSLTSFPTILLITTLFRLALNVSATRLILLQADAGEVIHAFGHFVVRGNYVVGAVVFLVLTLIQFIVIAKGSERVAEVGARFALDAMPGKQMSIDADLRSGALSQDEGRRRRRLLQRESQFYGAMDGAMKFVKGDAIASIVITLINLAGGLAVGVGMRDMEAGQALKTYGLLTIGDGLVSQIPALLLSTAAGLVVTRVASDDDEGALGSEIASQIFAEPRALRLAAIFLVLLAIIPGLPAFPFLVLAVLAGLLASRVRMRRSAEATDPGSLHARATAMKDARQRPAPIPFVVPIGVELGPELAARMLGDAAQDTLLEREIPRVRELLFGDLGFSMPAVHAHAAPALAPNAYRILVQEIPVAEGEIQIGKRLAFASLPELTELGIHAEACSTPYAPAREAALLDATDAELAARAGLEPLDEAAQVAAHLEVSVRRRAHDLFGLQETQSMLDQLERMYPALVRHVVPKPVPLPLLADVLKRLLDEGVSVRPLREILEGLATHAASERDPVTLTELVRASLKRMLTHRYAAEGVLSPYLLDPSIESTIRDAIQRTPSGSYLALAPSTAREITEAIIREGRPLAGRREVVIVTQADVRRFVRKLLESTAPQVTVLSYQELASEVVVQPVGRIAV